MKAKELIKLLESKDPEAEILILHMYHDPEDSWNDREIKNQLSEKMIRVGGTSYETELKGKIIIDLEMDY